MLTVVLGVRSWHKTIIRLRYCYEVLIGMLTTVKDSGRFPTFMTRKSIRSQMGQLVHPPGLDPFRFDTQHAL